VTRSTRRQWRRDHATVELPVNFFFAARRRHTRSKRDWSSDVCSSDLIVMVLHDQTVAVASREIQVVQHHHDGGPSYAVEVGEQEIGRASCRERGWIMEVVGSRKSTSDTIKDRAHEPR